MNQETSQDLTDQNSTDPVANQTPIILVPEIEEGVAIPKDSYEALPRMNNEEEVILRATTYKELTDITGDTIDPTPEEREQGEKIAEEMARNPKKSQDLAQYPNNAVAYLAGIVGAYNYKIVDDLADLKLYVVNKLVDMLEDPEKKISLTPKETISALRSIGEVDGVDAFKKKTEVTHKVESMDEVEKELLSMLNEFKAKGLIKAPAQTIDAEVIEEVKTHE